MKPFFDFRRPRFRHLDCIDLVLENKLLLFLSWDTLHSSKICIRPGAAVYRTTVGAAICRLPMGATSVDIILRNTWRSTRTSFRLKRIAVDQQTINYIDAYFLNGLSFTIDRIETNFTTPYFQARRLQLLIPLSNELSAYSITINHLQLNDYAT